MEENITVIDLKIDIKTLAEVIASCNLGMGTYEKPIAADYFVANLDLDNSAIDLIEDMQNIIKLKISSTSVTPFTPELLGVFIYPSGRKETMLSTNKVVKLFDAIFDCKGSYMNDRQLCIPAKKNKCNIKINIFEKEEMNYYFTYRVLFKLEIDNIPFCFSIDPFFSVRSRRPRS